MSATAEDLRAMFKEADRRGDRTTAIAIMNKLEALQKQQPVQQTAQQPEGFFTPPPPGTEKPAPVEPTMGEKVKGAAEAARALIQNGTLGALGQLGGTIEGIFKSFIEGTYGTYEGANKAEEIAMKRAQQFGYQPTTETGKKYTSTVGDVAANLVPLTGLTGEMAVLGTSTKTLKDMRSAARLEKTSRATSEAADVSQPTMDAVESSKPTTPAGEQIGGMKAGPEPEIKTYKQIGKDLKNKKTKRVAEQVMPDQEIIDAAKELGVEVNPSAYSTNRAYIDMEQALKSRPGSKLATMEEKSIVQLGEKADNLIKDLGGTTDKSLLDANVKSDITNTLNDLETKASTAYNAVENAIPRQTKVNIKASRVYMENTLKELNGNINRLYPVEKDLLSLTKGKRKPTYAELDRVRKDIGEGFKGLGAYGDTRSSVLKQVYKVLSEDQQGVADAFGVGEDYAAARRLVSSQKDLQKASIDLLGRDLQSSIIPKLTQSGTALTKGDVSKFNKLMNSLPKERRQEAAATMLNDLFTMGSRQKGAIGQGFKNAFEGLNRNKEAKNALFSYLPPGARKTFNNIGKVATGIYRSKALENNSRTARDIIAAMDDGGMFGKILNVGERITHIPFTGTSVVGIGSAILKKTPASEVSERLIMSAKFKKAIETAAEGNAKRAEQIMKSSPTYKEWLTTVPKSTVLAIGKQGFIPWVLGQQQEQ